MKQKKRYFTGMFLSLVRHWVLSLPEWLSSRLTFFLEVDMDGEMTLDELAWELHYATLRGEPSERFLKEHGLEIKDIKTLQIMNRSLKIKRTIWARRIEFEEAADNEPVFLDIKGDG